MIAINFEVVKIKSSFQLEVPEDSTVSNLSDLILEYYNLNKDDFSGTKDIGIKFVYNTKILRSTQTLIECGLKSDCKVSIFLPKPILSAIEDTSTKTSKKSSETTNSNQEHEKQISTPELNTNDACSTTTNIIDNSQENSSNGDYSKQINNQSESFDEGLIQSQIIELVDQNALEALVDLGFDRLDSAYALIYKKDVQYCVDLITSGVSTDPEYRNIINKLVSGQVHSTDAVLQEMEIAKIEAEKTNADVDLAVATVICEASIANRILDQSVKIKLKKICDSVFIPRGDEVKAKIDEDIQNGRQIIYFDPKTKITILVDFEKFYYFVLETEGKKIQQNMGYYQQNPMMNYPANNTMMFAMDPQTMNYGIQMVNPQMNYPINDTLQRNAAIDNFNQQFFVELNQIPSMTPDNFRNPFEELFISAKDLGDETIIAVFDYGRSLGYNQLRFIYDAYKKQISVTEVVQYLQIANGDIETAKSIMNLK